jgi:hypothetical protein
MLSFSQYLSEGINDPAIFKAVFMAGGPGSGKSFISGRTGLTSLGLRLINSDPAFEAALKKANLSPSSSDDIMSPSGQQIRGRVKQTIAKRLDLSTAGRLGLIIDGTGKDYDKISQQKEALEKLGYDCKMIFVNTSLATALQRNAARERSLPRKEVIDMWQGVQKNIGKFQNLFGGEHMIVVDNDKDVDVEKVTTSTFKKISKWVKQPPRNIIAKRWIDNARKQTVNESDLIGRYVTKTKNYKAALDTLANVLTRKGGPKKHSIEYYASSIAASYKGVDPKELAAMYKQVQR